MPISIIHYQFNPNLKYPQRRAFHRTHSDTCLKQEYPCYWHFSCRLIDFKCAKLPERRLERVWLISNKVGTVAWAYKEEVSFIRFTQSGTN